MLKKLLQNQQSSGSKSIKKKNLDRVLKKFSIDDDYKTVKYEIDLDYNYIVKNQPIGFLLFKNYCYREAPEFYDFISLLVLAETSQLQTQVNQEKFKSQFRYVFAVLDMFTGNTEFEHKLFDLASVNTLIESIHEYFAENLFDEFMNSTYFDQYLKLKFLEKKTLNKHGFLMKKYLSGGIFSNVRVCKSKVTNNYYACKSFDKSLVNTKQKDHLVYKEKEILQKVDSPFVIKLICTFETKNSICMITNLMSGGSLGSHIQDKTSCSGLGLQRCKFYAAEIICGLLYLHSMNIVHFDLKPDNILIDCGGHIRISDLGSAELLKDKRKFRFSLGTKLYMAPEILQRDYLSSAADWFSFGCILYEMIAGINPFRFLSKLIQYKNYHYLITKAKVVYKEQFNYSAKHLCAKLLNKNPSLRMKPEKHSNWSEELKKHLFFIGINWQMLESRNSLPPYIPKDEAYFLTRFSSKNIIKPLKKWTPTKENIDFYRTICSGAESVNWQKDIIESKCFYQLQ